MAANLNLERRVSLLFLTFPPSLSPSLPPHLSKKAHSNISEFEERLYFKLNSTPIFDAFKLLTNSHNPGAPLISFHFGGAKVLEFITPSEAVNELIYDSIPILSKISTPFLLNGQKNHIRQRKKEKKELTSSIVIKQK